MNRNLNYVILTLSIALKAINYGHFISPVIRFTISLDIHVYPEGKFSLECDDAVDYFCTVITTVLTVHARLV